MVEENGFENHYSQRRHADHHNPYAYSNGISGGVRESMEIIGDAGDDGAVHISHRISGINFTPTLHDSLVNEIRKLRNKLDKRESEVKSLNDELGRDCAILCTDSRSFARSTRESARDAQFFGEQFVKGNPLAANAAGTQCRRSRL